LNIFVLHENPRIAAEWHVDRHVVKMPLETAQMLCTARHELGGTPEHIPYRKAFTNHPCTIWARQSRANYEWLCKLGKALCEEYTHRYGKVHKCQAVIEDCIHNPPSFNKEELTMYAQAMDEEYKMENPILAYRNYYQNGKSHLHDWKDRSKPYWITEVKDEIL
tara:strand:- start:295 stop:786 length:492 start_codon:yes stop_codon:yes gene_type:complete